MQTKLLKEVEALAFDLQEAFLHSTLTMFHNIKQNMSPVKAGLMVFNIHI